MTLRRWIFKQASVAYVEKFKGIEVVAPDNASCVDKRLWLHDPAERAEYIGKLREFIALLESDACLFPEERAARDAAFNMQGVPKP